MRSDVVLEAVTMQSKAVYPPLVVVVTVSLMVVYFTVFQEEQDVGYDEELVKRTIETINHQLVNVMRKPQSTRVTEAKNRKSTDLLPHDYSETKLNLDVCKTPPHQWKPPVLPDYLRSVHQNDIELIRQIREHWILTPDSEPINITHPEHQHFAQAGQDIVLDRFFHNKTGGFFIECGAFDGESMSNSLYFERQRHWEGLLIEANPDSFQKIVSKHRNSYLLNACLSITEQAAYLNYTRVVSHPYLSRIETGKGGFIHRREAINKMAGEVQAENTELQCFPFYSVLRALGVDHVDFFSLDVEGADWDVLQTIPFHEVDIDLLVIEIGEGPGREPKIKHFEEYLSQFGYKTVDLEGDKYDVGMTRI